MCSCIFHRRISRLKSRMSPHPVVVTLELNPIMKSTPPSFPKLYLIGYQSITTPERWSLNLLLFFELFFFLLIFLLQSILTFDRFTLIWSPCWYFCTSWPYLEVLVRFFTWDLFYFAFNSNWFLEWTPPECECSKRIYVNFLAFARFIVCVPNESTLIKTFKEHHSVRWSTLVIASRQTHCIRFKHLRRHSLIIPLLEQIYRVSTFRDMWLVEIQITIFFAGLSHLCSECFKFWVCFWTVLRIDWFSMCVICCYHCL